MNESNKDFFQNSDGIFLNYNWTEETLKKSLDNAGVRKHDVYVGVDVFGRGCFGGGAFNSDLALEKIRQFDLSAAIFGQGWTHETKKDTESFQEREILFWSKLKPYLYSHVLIKDKKLSTNFNNGYGKYIFNNGRKESDCVKYDLTKQCIQTCSLHAFEYEDGFRGSGCLKISQAEQNKYYNLFLTHMEIHEAFKIVIVTKCSANYDYTISVYYESKKEKHKFILTKDEKECEDFSSTIVHPESKIEDKNELVWIRSSWDVRTFIIKPQFKGIVTQVGGKFNSELEEILLGHFVIHATCK